MHIERNEKLRRIVAPLLAGRVAVQRVSRKCGLKLQRAESEFCAELDPD